MEKLEYQRLLDIYRKLWNSRSLICCDDEEHTLKEAILRELKDENTHPRVRQTMQEKFYQAVKRLLDSPLKEKDKIQLISVYVEIAEKLKQ
ncbi:hypothetical protein [Bacillus massilinigeriensis]|uniref:hypothetical protein n=1 Tax=Bacillus mediterraneensis TaxID=1805474 RepID=UPI001F325788|nr:hypothetical protein [Bacillus mediterraneensis]